jgi:nucleotide-binding universal stress UspA family protein
MSKPILVGFDPVSRDRAPIHFALAAARLTGAPVIVAAVEAGPPVIALSAGQTLPYAIAHADPDLVEDCSEALAEVERELGAEGAEVACRKLRGTSAARALHEAAEEMDAGLLVVGSSRRGTAERLLLGSTAEKLIHGAPCPIAVVPQAWTRERDIATIGVAYTDSEESREALRGAYALARRTGATLRVVTVVKPGLSMYLEADTYKAGQHGRSVEEVEGDHLLAARREIERAVGELGADVPVEADALLGDPAEVLIDLSRTLDLLVCGSRGYGPMRAVLLGSVSRRVAGEARCPVIVLPRGVKASLEALVEEGAAATA